MEKIAREKKREEFGWKARMRHDWLKADHNEKLLFAPYATPGRSKSPVPVNTL